MLGHTLVVVSDAHLGAAPPAAEEALLAFFDAVPTLGDCLLINGDLFDFWYSYRRVVPRRGFRVAAALAALRRRLPIVMVGGNHDRWGGDFWERDLGMAFDRHRVRFEIGTRRVSAIHGDGFTEPTLRARLVHRLINHPVTEIVYRVLHPELALRLVDRLSPHLGDDSPDERRLAAAAERQREWAVALLAREPELGLLIMGHTHRAELSQPFPGRQYLNPGAWLDGCRYAVATETGAELRVFTPAGPLPPTPAAPR